MTTSMLVNFSDATSAVVQDWFGIVADPANPVYQNMTQFLNQGVVTTSDPRYATYYALFANFFPPGAGMPSPTTD